jgi:hypothetical protein
VVHLHPSLDEAFEEEIKEGAVEIKGDKILRNG